MSEVRQRKLRDADSLPPGRRPSSRKARPQTRLQRAFLLATLFAAIIFFGFYTALLNPVVDHIASRLGYRHPVYAVIIDAGSTGSRVLAYTFHKSYLGGQLVLDSELFKEVKPGLSSYVDHPEKGAESIMSLIRIAHGVIPPAHRPFTPLLVRATAGLRLLEAGAAEDLLEAVRSKLTQQSGFHLGPDAVEIMDGMHEGVYSWFTVNFLKDRLSSEQTCAALDLGGGSTQITYEPGAEHPPPGPLTSVPGPDRNITLFTYSYLNLGLMAARHGIMTEVIEGDPRHLVSECINPIIKKVVWKYANQEYFVSGSTKDIRYKEVVEQELTVSEKVPVVRVEACRARLGALLKQHLPPGPPHKHLRNHDVNAFSYYFDRASEAGLIDPVNGGRILVKQFREAAKMECEYPNVDQPWACLDLSYISVLLEEAFQLPPNKELELVKKINGHEISWALGLAYNNLINPL